METKSEQRIVQVPKSEVTFTLDHHATMNSKTRLMHLSYPSKSERGTGNQGKYTAQKEETPTMMFPLSDQGSSDFEFL